MEPDEIIHQSVRLKIMSALNALADLEAIDFTRLKVIAGATDGNLGAHIATLENAGYVKIDKDFVGKKPRTRITMTKDGRKAFARHVAYLRDVLDSAGST
ncbi:MAG: transcriptional regulator [Rhodospirillaceae bacterium]|nr:transcriptional regulator [Rhodospirillaceae bacterium]